MVTISARVRDSQQGWGGCVFSARSFGTGVRTAARKLGLRGPILNTERVGSSQWAVNVNGCVMMIIADEVVS